MFCSHCGKEMQDEAVVCTNCGSLLKGHNVQETSPKAEEKNGMAIAGFVCSFFIPLLGWIFGGIGLSKANKRNGKGRGFSIAALIISTISFFINLVLMY